MFPRAEAVLKQVNLDTVTPEEALAVVQQLPTDMLHHAHFTYYEGLFRVLALVAEAALRNAEKKNERKGMPV